MPLFYRNKNWKRFDNWCEQCSKREYPDFSMIVGAPAKVIKQYSFETQKWGESVE